ncbi:hypothetical protein J1614_003291 [Plenodomus biglobosus]|nr:hypothetical protein J1614_003291 [Plenodomus biglobosus]
MAAPPITHLRFREIHGLPNLPTLYSYLASLSSTLTRIISSLSLAHTPASNLVALVLQTHVPAYLVAGPPTAQSRLPGLFPMSQTASLRASLHGQSSILVLLSPEVGGYVLQPCLRLACGYGHLSSVRAKHVANNTCFGLTQHDCQRLRTRLPS